MKLIDNFLDRITMYRLVLYYLLSLLAAAVGLSLAGTLHFNALGIVVSAAYLTLVCWLTNRVFARVFETPSNTDSAFITALILSLIITPLHSPHDLLFMTAAGILAMASKYILSIRKKHLFNPAAAAVLLLSFGAGQTASWWVGSSALLLFVLIGGLLVVRKIKRSAMVLSFLLAAAGSSLMINLLTNHNATTDLRKLLLHTSVFFLAFVMLTEPLTSPATEDMRIWYAILVGVLFPPQVHLGSLYTTPELALIVGNVFAYIVSPKYKLLPKFKQKLQIAKDVMDFTFVPERAITYKPGQYMEWTLAHHRVDSRGNRRYLTLASSPTENELRVGVKFYPNGSSYKKAMLAMNDKTPIAAGQLGGDFTLPGDKAQKLAFIAGGIGVTPFRSMTKYLIDTKERRDIVLVYSENREEQLVYRDIFDQAGRELGMKTIYTLTDMNSIKPTWQGQKDKVSAQMIKTSMPDYEQRMFYISGPQPMVKAVKALLHSMGIPNNQIKTDLFPGYA